MSYKLLLIIYIALLVVSSLITLIMYKVDKKRAIKGKDRIKEKILLELSVLFGSVGAFLGRIIFRHKTDKVYFSIVIYSSLLVHSAILIMIISKVVS